MMPKACTCHALGCCTYYGWQPVVTMARVSGWFYGIKQGIGGSQQPWRFLSCSKGMPLGQPRQSRAGTLWIVPAECFGCLTVAGTVPCLYVQRCQTANMPMHASIRRQYGLPAPHLHRGWLNAMKHPVHWASASPEAWGNPDSTAPLGPSQEVHALDVCWNAKGCCFA